jgi:imidazolonepropionase-like amidohydrolase
LIEKDKIVAAGSVGSFQVPAETKIIEYPGGTILPGLIEGHSHILLHPYNETSWNDQVLVESLGERIARATIHAEKTLKAGFTTIRDLGTEGAGYADVGIKQAIEKGVIQGPRMLVAGPAIVTTGSYGPKGFAPEHQIPVGADVADGVDELTKLVRGQIGRGVDIIKVYADYRWGPDGQAMPTFTMDELELVVALASSSGRPVVAHASTPEGMRRATLAGVNTIEHGDAGNSEVFSLMKKEGVAFCPTLAAGDAVSQYRGWEKNQNPEPSRITEKRKSFKQALVSGVTIIAGGDVGVFAHGDNARELEMMVEYGMSPIEVLKSVTSVNASVFGLGDRIGSIKNGLIADILVVMGNPLDDIRNIRNVIQVLKNGKFIGN